MNSKKFSVFILSVIIIATIISMQGNFIIDTGLKEKNNQVLSNKLVIINAPGTIIENQRLTATNITLINSPNSIIRNNTVSGFSSSYGIYVKNSNNTIIENNTIKDLNNNLVSANSFGIFVDHSNNITIHDNFVSDIASMNVACGIGLNASSKVIVHDNYVSNLNNNDGSYGILDMYGVNITIRNNFVSALNSSYGTSGIYSFFGSSVFIINNSVQSINTQSTGCCYFSTGIFAFYTIYSNISKNKISSITASGTAFNYGINVRQSNISIVENNTLSNFTSISNGEIVGIYFDSSNNISITFNLIDSLLSKNGYAGGIVSQRGENNSINSNILTNIVSLATNVRGIYFIENPRIFIENNILEDISSVTYLYGIYGSSSDNFEINNNKMVNLTTIGYYQAYRFTTSNNSKLSIPAIYKINILPNIFGVYNYEITNNGTFVQSGVTSLTSGASLDFTNITGEYNNISLTFIGTSENETYQLTLLKPMTPIQSVTAPKIVNPLNNTNIINQTRLKLEWIPSNDSFNNIVRYTLYYSNDSMNTWSTLTQDLINNSYWISLTKLNLTYNSTIFIKLISFDNELNEIQNNTVVTFQLTFIINPPEITPTTTPITTPTTTSSSSTTTTNTSLGKNEKTTSINNLSILLGLVLFSILAMRKRRKIS